MREPPLFQPPPKTLPLLAACAASCLGGSAVVVTRMLSHTMSAGVPGLLAHGAGASVDALTLALLRYGLATLCFAPLAFCISPHRRVAWRDLSPVIALGILYFGAFPLLFTAALARTTATSGALVISLVPILTLLLGVFLRRERASLAKVAGMLLATTGVALSLLGAFSHPGHTSEIGARLWQGDILMLLAAIASATYGVLSRPFVARNGALPVMGYGMVAGSLALLCAKLAVGPLSIPSVAGFGEWLAIFYLAIPGCALAFFLLVWAYGKIEASRVAVFLTLNPVVAMFAGMPLLGERLEFTKVLGLGLVISGIMLVAREAPKVWRRRASTAALVAPGRARA